MIAKFVAKSHFWNTEQELQATEIVAGHRMPFTTWTKVDGKRKLLASGTLNGTVFSGHPTRTTFGNSVRVYLYTDYIMHLAKIKNYKIWVCGDDMLAIIEKEDV